MGRKVFVSYKYGDTNVKFIAHEKFWEPTKVRDYVDVLEDKIGKDNVYCGEQSGEDLSDKSEDYIWEHLKDKIFPTSVTVVLISPEMKEPNRYDKSQWIPWEIKYSLCEYSRSSYKSHSNGIVAVVLPDVNDSYGYMIEHLNCCQNRCRLTHKEKLFWILQKNMFNKKNPNTSICAQNSTVYYGEYSYISIVTWDDFIKNDAALNGYLDEAAEKKDRKATFNLYEKVNKE